MSVLADDGAAEPAGPASGPAAPLFPEQTGTLVHEILNGPPPSGPPYTHTFRLPPTEYDEDGVPIRPRIGPSLTRMVSSAGFTDLMAVGLREAERQHAYLRHAWLVGIDQETAGRVLHEVLEEVQQIPDRCDAYAIAEHRLVERPGSRPPEHLREAARQLLAAGGCSLHPEVVDRQARILQHLTLSWTELHRLHRACFCHTKPFPAARDYRRRTKHRNRRRRRAD